MCVILVHILQSNSCKRAYFFSLFTYYSIARFSVKRKELFLAYLGSRIISVIPIPSFSIPLRANREKQLYLLQKGCNSSSSPVWSCIYQLVSTCESDPLLLPRAPKSLCSRYVHSIFVDTVEIILWITDEELWITILQSPWRISSAFEVLVVWPYTTDAKVTSTMMRVSNTNFIFRLQNHC